MKSDFLSRAGLGLVFGLSLDLSLGLSLGIGVTAAGAQDSGAPLFENGRMLRPLVQDVLEGSALITRCDPDPSDLLRMNCLFDGTGQAVDVRMNGLLARLQSAQADPRAEILTFANDVLIKGDPDRVFPQRTQLRPLVRARGDVARTSAEERLPDAALFPVPGFPEAVAFAVRDDEQTVHLVQSADDASLGYAAFPDIMERAIANAPWIREGQATLRCDLRDDQQRYCRVQVDQFYEASLVLDPSLGPWLAAQLGEPSLIAIPARDELLVAPLSDRGAVQDLEARLKHFRPYSITHGVAFWDGKAGSTLQPVEKWSLRGGLWLPARVVVRTADGAVLSFSL